MKVYKNELSYFINGTESEFAVRGFISLHGPVSDNTDTSSAGVRIGQTADGRSVHFTQFTRLYSTAL